MIPAQLSLLQRSFASIEPRADEFGAFFSERLFAIAPDMKALLRADSEAQQPKSVTVLAEFARLHLRAMISLPATAQTSGEAVLPGAYWSGRLHAAYGVRMEDFGKMKEALVWALQQTLRDEFTPEVAEAWALAYDIVARAMQSGMKSNADDEREPESNMQIRLNRIGEVEDGAEVFRKIVGDWP